MTARLGYLPLDDRGGEGQIWVESSSSSNSEAVIDIHQRLNGRSPTLSAAASFSATNRSEFFGVCSAGAVLGRRGKWIIIDDPVSGYEEANSMTQMAKLHNAFEAEILTRLVPGAKVVLIQQRLSRNDLAGYLIDRASRVEGGRKTTVSRVCAGL